MLRIACVAAGLLLVSPGAVAQIALANPASVFCGKMGGKTVMAKLSNGDEIGLCYLPGDKIVEEWTLFRMFDGKKPAPARNPFRNLKPK